MFRAASSDPFVGVAGVVVKSVAHEAAQHNQGTVATSIAQGISEGYTLEGKLQEH